MRTSLMEGPYVWTLCVDYGLSSVNRYEKKPFVYIVLTYWTLSLLNYELVSALFPGGRGEGGTPV